MFRAGVSMSMEQQELLEQVRPARRVLVVDDHASFRRCASDAARRPRGSTSSARRRTAPPRSPSRPELVPELVLLDIQLPDLDGFAVAERLLASQPELQIVLVSSRDRPTYGPLIEASGARGFVSKGDLSGAALERLLE